MSLKEVLVDELKDLYSAENQLVKALPKIVKACEDEELAESISSHLEETKGHVERLKQAFELLGKKAVAKHCNGMEGLLKEGKEAIEEDEDAPFGDLMITGAASRVEHYEIAGYSAVIAIAEGLGEDEVVQLLTETLEEEQAASEKLSAKAKELIAQAVAESEDDAVSEEDEEGEAAISKTSTASAKKPVRGRTKAA
ncbi:YciE/YciF ferroxidase family protein [Terriglobus tenax]|uniref:YciE/YciF ferroxidase family protein n=1 Tax=Terriglobus tenax TaxID=1111115 RepID=UPI0021E0D423|nr:ferritin-like domain-containing protein [Terriglobus tenax]